MAEAKLTAVIEAEDRASATLAKVGKSAEGLGKKIGDLKPMFSTMAVGGTVAFGAISTAMYSSIKSANEAAAVTAQLNAVIKSTGGVAGVTAEAVLNLSTELQKTTTYNDEAVTAAQNLLLTFTKIGKDVFPEATATILDMSTALGQDTKSSAMQLGKALNDPIKGISALRKVGIAFTDEQEKQIETLVKSGKTMEAQRMILKELAVEFGGSASAQAKTFEGRVIQLKNRLDDMQQGIGEALIPIIEKMVEKIAPAVDAVISWIENNPKLTATVLIVSAAIAGLVTALGLLGVAVIAFQAVSLPLLLTFGGITLAIGAIIAIGVLLYKNWENIKIIAADVWQYVVQAWNGIKNSVTNTMTSIGEAITIVWESIKVVFTNSVAFLMGSVMVLLDWLFPAWESTLFSIYNKTIEIFTFLKAYFGSALDELRIRITDSLAIIKTVWTNVWTTMKSIFVSIWDSIAKIFDSVIDGITKGMEKLVGPIQKVITLAEKALSLAGGAVSSVKGKISSGISSILDRGKSALGIDDGIVQNGQIISTHPEDTIVAMKDWSKFGGGGKNININISGAILNEEAAKVMGDLIISQLRMQLKF